MSARYSQKANLLAGGFLIAGVVLAVLTSFVLADVSFVSKTDYVIEFSLRDGATGLAPDAAVRVGGQPEGKVKAVKVVRDGGGEYVVRATVTLRSDIELFEDAWAYLEIPLLGTASTINIPYVGTGAEVPSPQGSSARLERGEILNGSIAPPLFLANAGFGPDQREQLQRMFTSAEQAMRDISETLADLRPRVDPVAEDVQETAASARRTMQGIEGDVEAWRGTITTTLDNARTFSDKLPPLGEDARIVLADAKEIIRSGRAVIDDNRPRIDNIIANADSAMAGVNDEWIPRGTQLFDTASAGVDQFASVARSADEMVAAERPGLERTLANLRIASDQLKFLAIEARSQPWRLLHRPDTKELETQLLYDSARSYAVAVGDLRAASESLDALVARTSASGAVDIAELQSMRDKLQQAFEKYAQAETDLLDRMIEANQ